MRTGLDPFVGIRAGLILKRLKRGEASFADIGMAPHKQNTLSRLLLQSFDRAGFDIRQRQVLLALTPDFDTFLFVRRLLCGMTIHERPAA